MKKFHELADAFPLIEGREFDELVADIKAYGLREPIVLLNDEILDGRNRARACEAAGVEPNYTTYPGDDPVAYVISCDVRRRHLTGRQKRELIGRLLEAGPERSNLQIARTVNADDKTVASVREEKETRSEIPNVKSRLDTKGRKQPVKRRTSPRGDAASGTDTPATDPRRKKNRRRLRRHALHNKERRREEIRQKQERREAEEKAALERIVDLIRGKLDAAEMGQLIADLDATGWITLAAHLRGGS